MPSKPKAILWDSCIAIDAIQKDPEHYPAIAPFLDDAEKGKLLIVLSEVSVAEITTLNNLDAQGMPLEEQERMIRDWLENPYIVRKQFHRGISQVAGQIGRLHKLKSVGDRAVVGTAYFYKIPLIHTYDGTGRKGQLLKLDSLIGNPPIRIMIPNYYEETLFDNTKEEQSRPESPEEEARPET